MAALLPRVKSKMFIFAHRKVRGLLDGEYGSVFKGSSLDFDDLRAYVPGDDVRAIDWKATARHGSPLIRRYVAVRQQNVLLVTDTGRNMAAVARGGETKKDLAVLALGVIGLLAQKHGDPVGLVSGDASGSRHLPAQSGEAHLERLLRDVDGASLSAPPSRLQGQLEYIASTFGRRMLLFVVADEVTADAGLEKILRRLRAQHEILWLTIRDAELANAEMAAVGADTFSVDDFSPLLRRLAGSPAVARSYAEAMERRDGERSAMLRRVGISEGELGSSAEVMPALFSLLERHRRGG
ncbi:DUF58 domain-containing protein [Pseudarthrobacter sp. J75]|uniref:DUF58 domain-containing protein n=1 Tax=unclassified Pseudarthrobacter TaxID=2647000 RepID=UPI002E81DF2A|nr:MULTISPECIES: DUF58 domain-containing protein [unclassified Pseudarthrobacter]MEE2523446.1 DUF58 domain-containing protein [Pseudarthrobacter sp. J47]MEE2529411.1 DUF58 domain-containing protein [Pseudarthrobacter sp. J75]